ncbi:energy transducer TonB [Candidatus Thiothrix anitrata]|uniref:Energy transducer TonB n=1 Tax=Candidatus Thiothrix anitrata TaxID=2823902 RepID=A0ABX7X5Z6_9GAMM|nr:energy transducer TonB [Candidatus Thiothrix anitrata]QTR51289.1 energy transducer TonB [Candidatus Thiothrix anitrata]
MPVLPMNLADEPLAKTLPVALLLHLLLIGGVGFIPGINPQAYLAPVLDITLVQTHSEEAPDEVDFIAQANQQASGNSDQKNRPTSPLSSLLPNDVEGDSPVQTQASMTEAVPKLQPQILTTKGETFKRVDKTPEQPEEEQPEIAAERSDATQEIAQLLAEVDEEEARYARRPRIHFIDAVSAKSAVEAEYIDAWVKKIERVGNINFPEEAVRRQLNGKLILNATVDHQGRIVDTQISVSSGYEVLDKAATRIVELAGPYPPLPNEIRRKWDQLNITRTWLFHSGTLNTQ